MNLQSAFPVQSATVAARLRTGDKAISTSVRDGLYRVERVEYVGSRSVVSPLTDFLPKADVLKALNAIGA